MKRFLFLAMMVIAVFSFLPSCEELFPSETGTETDGGKENGGEKENVVQAWDTANPPARPDWFDIYYWDRTDRQIAGLRGKVKSHHITKYTTYDEYVYDEAGHLTAKKYVNTTDSSSNTDELHTYDAAGHRTRTEIRYPASDNYLATWIDYEYGNTGKYVPTQSFGWARGLWESSNGYPITILKDLSKMRLCHGLADHIQCTEWSYSFGGDGNLVITEDYFWYPIGGDPTNKDTRTNEEITNYTVVYNNGMPYSSEEVISTEYFSNGMVKSQVLRDGEYHFVANDQANVIETFDSTVEPNGMLPIWWKKYKYNDNMDPTDLEECSVEKTRQFHDTWTDYRYDSHWNWIERTETIIPRWFGETYPDKIEREILYYE